MAGVHQVNSRQRANKALELSALASWALTFGARVKADPLYASARDRADALVEELCQQPKRRPIPCPLFPKLEGVVGIQLYVVVGRKRTLLRKDLTPLATKAGIEHLHGVDHYYVQAFGEDGRMLAGRKL